ncbi:MAG: chemotaxis protein CheW [Gammaproteobacteria bacterium]|nr:chemotaxis protein CheW [Gammaproteobacteria bacterium]
MFNKAVNSAQPTKGDADKFLSFKMGNENFGIGILSVKEIIEYGGITDVPMMPDFVRGAINLRGHVVPVMDLAIRLGRKPQEVSRRTCVVIVEVMSEGYKLDVGIVVDAVNEVIDIVPENIEPAPTLGGKVKTEFLKGMGKIGEKFLVLLNIENVLTLKDIELINTTIAGGLGVNGGGRA